MRRFASEGCRPRLPWGRALPAFKADPRPILPVLEKLKADESEYVLMTKGYVLGHPATNRTAGQEQPSRLP